MVDELSSGNKIQDGIIWLQEVGKDTYLLVKVSSRYIQYLNL